MPDAIQTNAGEDASSTALETQAPGAVGSWLCSQGFDHVALIIYLCYMAVKQFTRSNSILRSRYLKKGTLSKERLE